MKHKIIYGLAAASVLFGVPMASAQSQHKSFEEFRKGIMSDYNQFRKTILDHYADFLNGEWHEYESLNAMKRYDVPKPEEVPVVEGFDEETVEETPQRFAAFDDDELLEMVGSEVSVEESNTDKIWDVFKDIFKKKGGAKKEKKQKEKVIRKGYVRNGNTYVERVIRTAPKPEASAATAQAKPASQPAPKTPVAQTGSSAPKPGLLAGMDKEIGKPKIAEKETFTFYSIPVSVPKIDFELTNGIYMPSDYASHWTTLDKSQAKTILPELKKISKDMGLNDYLEYELVKSYIDSKFPDADDAAKFSATHYLMANAGYDVRLGISGKGVPLLLVPLDQMVYARRSVGLGDRKYYIFSPDSYDDNRLDEERLSTCYLPDAAAQANQVGVSLGSLKIPRNPKKFDIEYGPIHLQGEVNANLMPILYRYPQTEISEYAKANVDPELRAQLVEQVKSQLAGMDPDTAVEQLLGFVQNAFDYATDDDFHGFEKPYFLEENLFYPRNDCEDRAIFYTYFLWNALGKEAQLIAYPGHEAAAVKLEKPKKGGAYQYGGNVYNVSDPTYIGASTGMVMNMFQGVMPKIDYTYKAQ